MRIDEIYNMGKGGVGMGTVKCVDDQGGYQEKTTSRISELRANLADIKSMVANISGGSVEEDREDRGPVGNNYDYIIGELEEMIDMSSDVIRDLRRV